MKEQKVNTPRKSKINLATAKIADGQSRSVQSVYEMVGLSNTNYKHKSLADYSKMINGLNLIELQDHAFNIGSLPGPDRTTLINRLERKFATENARFSAGVEQPDNSSGDPDVRSQAEKILSQGR